MSGAVATETRYTFVRDSISSYDGGAALRESETATLFHEINCRLCVDACGVRVVWCPRVDRGIEWSSIQLQPGLGRCWVRGILVLATGKLVHQQVCFEAPESCLVCAAIAAAANAVLRTIFVHSFSVRSRPSLAFVVARSAFRTMVPP